MIYDSTVAVASLRRLGEALPDIVAEAVDCPEEPWIGPPAIGDLEIRFRCKGEFDVGGLNLLAEVRTKWFESRLADKQRRADLIRDRISDLVPGPVGVWLILAEGAWAQS
ncbi:MAG: hypothetical protein JO291_03215 [Acidimicrobiia bacterium]|nr:hypothetical protein [Acidimicrobiia bacterium]